MRYAMITIVEQVGPSAFVSVGDEVTAAQLAQQLGGSVSSEPADSDGPWWTARKPYNHDWAEWVVGTIAIRESVTPEVDDINKLAVKNTDAERQAYITYLEEFYHRRGQG